MSLKQPTVQFHLGNNHNFFVEELFFSDKMIEKSELLVDKQTKKAQAENKTS